MPRGRRYILQAEPASKAPVKPRFMARIQGVEKVLGQTRPNVRRSPPRPRFRRREAVTRSPVSPSPDRLRSPVRLASRYPTSPSFVTESQPRPLAAGQSRTFAVKLGYGILPLLPPPSSTQHQYPAAFPHRDRTGQACPRTAVAGSEDRLFGQTEWLIDTANATRTRGLIPRSQSPAPSPASQRRSSDSVLTAPDPSDSACLQGSPGGACPRLRCDPVRNRTGTAACCARRRAFRRPPWGVHKVLHRVGCRFSASARPPH